MCMLFRLEEDIAGGSEVFDLVLLVLGVSSVLFMEFDASGLRELLELCDVGRGFGLAMSWR